MPFARPTLAQLLERVGAAWRTRFPGADTNLRQSPDRAVVAVIAGATDEDLAYLDWQKDQLFPFSADVDYLERWATAKGLARKPASAAGGTIALAGTAGETAPAGTELQTDSGLVVVLAADATLDDDGVAEAAATARTGGTGGNLGIGTRLTFVGTPPGFADTATVATDFAGGADAESDASLRLRTLRRLAQPSFGGNRNDWEQAALAVPGVTRVFSLAATPTPGAVTLFPLFDNLRADGLPAGVDAWFRPGTGVSAGTGGAGDQRLVLDAILATRPVCAHLYVTALVAAPIAVTVNGLATDTAAVRAAIAAELRRMLVRRAGPGTTILRAWIEEAISRAAGEDGHTLTVPAGNTAVAAGHLATLGVVTYV